MEANPFIGVLFHAIGGLAAASFYIPYKRVKAWSWEIYWLVGGLFSWIIAPWVLAMILLPETPQILSSAAFRPMFWTWFFGFIWGIGGLTFGLTMRYLGIALGYAIALGLCAAFGTLIPPIFKGEFGAIVSSTSGQVTLLGVLVCLGGIALSGKAGMQKEQELSDEAKQATVKEFSFGKGVVVALVAGVLSAAMAYAFAAGAPIAELAVEMGAKPLWQNLPVLILALFGGFVSNAVWCIGLAVRNKRGGELLGRVQGEERPALAANYFFCALAGLTWYLQFFFYGMGETQMGDYKFSSWTLHMASIIIFSTLWGILLKEWKGTSRKTHMWIGLGLFVLILSTVIIGYGNTLGSGGGGH